MGETLVNPFCRIGLSLAFLVASVNYFRQKKYKLASVFLGGSMGLLFTKLAMSVSWLPGGPGGEDLIIFAPTSILVGMAGGWLIATPLSVAITINVAQPSSSLLRNRGKST